jgi:pimeloyl-ACP methyl ester carboxylesterase
VFIHGGGQGSWVWKETIAALNVQEREAFGKIVTLDIPGCGVKRGRALEHLQPSDVARELIAEIEAAELKNIVLVGHSLGGNVMPALTDLGADLFHYLIYVSCSIPQHGQTVIELMGNGLHGSDDNEVGWPVDRKTASPLERYGAMYCNDMSEEQKAAFISNHEGDVWPMSYFDSKHFDFETIGKIPATYVICLADGSLPIAWQKKFAERFRVERHVYIHAGHQAMITRPHALAEIIRHESLRKQSS